MGNTKLNVVFVVTIVKPMIWLFERLLKYHVRKNISISTDKACIQDSHIKLVPHSMNYDLKKQYFSVCQELAQLYKNINFWERPINQLSTQNTIISSWTETFYRIPPWPTIPQLYPERWIQNYADLPSPHTHRIF